MDEAFGTMSGTGDAGCRRTRDLMPLHYYAGLDREEAGALERHLEACASCSLEWARTRRVLDGVDAAAAYPREAEIDWDGFARRTVARARQAEAEGRVAGTAWPAGVGTAIDRLRRAAGLFGRMPVPARLGVAAAAAGSLIMMMTMLSRVPQGPGVAGRGEGGAPADVSPPEAARFIEGRMARRGAARYLVDSRALLLNLVESPVPCRKTDGDFDIRMEKARARDLLRRKNLYQGSLGGLEDARLAGLVRQLESILLQVSSLEDCATGRQIHDLSEAIERRQILLRIDLVTRDLAEGGARA